MNPVSVLHSSLTNLLYATVLAGVVLAFVDPAHLSRPPAAADSPLIASAR